MPSRSKPTGSDTSPRNRWLLEGLLPSFRSSCRKRDDMIDREPDADALADRMIVV